MKQKKQKQARNWHAVNAHFRNSAGAMEDNKKKKDKQACRNWNRADQTENNEEENVWDDKHCDEDSDGQRIMTLNNYEGSTSTSNSSPDGVAASTGSAKPS